MLERLFCAAEKYKKKHNLSLTTIGRICAKDSRFFSRLKAGNTLTLKKYEAVMHFLTADEKGAAQ